MKGCSVLSVYKGVYVVYWFDVGKWMYICEVTLNELMIGK